MRVDAAVGDEADEVDALAGRGVDGFLQSFVLGLGAVTDGEVDAGEFLVNDAAGAEVEVADLGISHLALGQADFQAAGLESAPGIVLIETIVDRGLGEEGGIALFLRTDAAGGIDAPTVTNEEKNGSRHRERVTQRVAKSRVDLSQLLASARRAVSWGLRFLRKKRTILP